jgi:hypothetical protein
MESNLQANTHSTQVNIMSEPTLQTGTDSQPSARVADRRKDPAMQKLFQMSRTAGVGLQDYRAVNVVSVVALMVGVASFFCIVFRDYDMLLALPVLAVILGLVAAIQIARSNRTQTGIPMAVAGLLLGAGFFSYNLYARGHIARENTRFQQELSSVVQQFGAAVAAQDYAGAREHLHPRLRERIGLVTFQRVVDPILRSRAVYGAVGQGMSLGDRVEFVRDASGVSASGLMVIELDAVDPRTNRNGRAREPATFARSGEDWRIADVPNWFPPDIDDRRNPPPPGSAITAGPLVTPDVAAQPTTAPSTTRPQ